MKNNTLVRVVNPLDEAKVRKAQNAMLQAKKRLGNWRAVGIKYETHHRYCWDLAYHAAVPRNPDIRRKLGLPRVLPSERKPRVKRVSWRAGLEKGLERL